jgi:uncharacterized protein
MPDPKEGQLLRIFLDENDRHDHKPLYEAIVLKARETNLAGATVLRGPLGFGATHKMHTAKFMDVEMNLPIVIEIVDSEEKIKAFLPLIETMMHSGLATLEKVKIIYYQGKSSE